MNPGTRVQITEPAYHALGGRYPNLASLTGQTGVVVAAADSQGDVYVRLDSTGVLVPNDPAGLEVIA